jgi:hypothetical protein
LIRNLTSPHTKKITNKTTSTSFFFFFFFFNHTVFRLSSTTQATQNPEVFFSPSKPETKTSEIIFPSQPKTDSKGTKPKRTSTLQCTNLSAAAAAAIVPEDHSSARRHHQIPSSSQNHLPSRSCVFLPSPGGQPRSTIYQKTFFLSASSFFPLRHWKKISPLIRPQSVQRVKCQTESP